MNICCIPESISSSDSGHGPEASKAHSAIKWFFSWNTEASGRFSVSTCGGSCGAISGGWLDMGIETTKHLYRGHGPIWIQSGSNPLPPPAYSRVESHQIDWEETKRIRAQPSSYSSRKPWWCVEPFWFIVKMVSPARASPSQQVLVVKWRIPAAY